MRRSSKGTVACRRGVRCAGSASQSRVPSRPLIGLDDPAHERMAHDVAGAEADHRELLDPLQLGDRVVEARTRTPSGRSVWLGSPQITIRRAHAEAGQEHLHLLRRGVLRLVEDDEGVGERAAAHEGDRRDLDLAGRDPPLDLLGRQHVVERVVERAEIGIDLLLHVAGQEAEPLARLDRGPRQDQPVDRAADQLLHRLGDREIGLAGARRARARRSCRRGPAPPYRRPAALERGTIVFLRVRIITLGGSITSGAMIPSSVGWPDMAMIALTSLGVDVMALVEPVVEAEQHLAGARRRLGLALDLHLGRRARRYRRRAGPRSRPGCGRTRRTGARADAAARTRARAGRGARLRRRWACGSFWPFGGADHVPKVGRGAGKCQRLSSAMDGSGRAMHAGHSFLPLRHMLSCNIARRIGDESALSDRRLARRHAQRLFRAGACPGAHRAGARAGSHPLAPHRCTGRRPVSPHRQAGARDAPDAILSKLVPRRAARWRSPRKSRRCAASRPA